MNLIVTTITVWLLNLVTEHEDNSGNHTIDH